MAVVEDLNRELFGERPRESIAEMSRPHYGGFVNRLRGTPLLYKPTEEGALAVARSQDGVEETGLLAPTGNVYDLRGPRGTRVYRVKEDGVKYYSSALGPIGFVPDNEGEESAPQGRTIRQFLYDHRKQIAAGVLPVAAFGGVLSMADYAYAQKAQGDFIGQSGNPDSVYMNNPNGQEEISSWSVDLQGKGLLNMRFYGDQETKVMWLKMKTEKGRMLYFTPVVVGGKGTLESPNYETHLALFEKNGDVDASLTFKGFANGRELTSIAGVLPAQAGNSFSIPMLADERQAAYTGYSIANVTPDEGNLMFTPYSNGQIKGYAIQPIPPYGQISIFPYQHLTGIEIPKEFVEQINSDVDIVVNALTVEQGKLSVVPVTEGTYKTVLPVVSVWDMFGNGTLDPAKVAKITTGGKLILQEVTTNGRRWEFNINKYGYASFRAADGTYPQLINQLVDWIVDVPGYAQERQKRMTFSEPVAWQVANSGYFNPALVKRLWGTSWGYTGMNLKPLDEKEWKFYFDTRNMGDLNNTNNPNLLKRDLFKHFSTKELPQSGFTAGGKPLGAQDIIQTNSPPTFPTNYAFIVSRDNSISSVLLSVASDTANWKVRSVLVRYPDSASNPNVASDLYGIFGEDDNGVLVKDFGMSVADSVLVGLATIYTTPLDRYRHRYKLLKPAGTIVQDDHVRLPDKPN